MKRFTELFLALDGTNKTSVKLEALRSYFKDVSARDAAWAVTYLTGKRPKAPVNSGQIKQWVTESAQISEWLFGECYDAVGDLAETVSLLLPVEGKDSHHSLSEWIENRLLQLHDADEDFKKRNILQWWHQLDQSGRFVFTKLLTGAWRIGVSQKLVSRALAQALGIEADVITHRLMGNWKPDDDFYTMLSSSDTSDADVSKPYPFYLAYPCEDDTETLGDISDWLIEWKWDGIRAQVIKRADQVHIWSRGEELISHRFPEVSIAAESLPNGTVIDGELLAWSDENSTNGVLPFAQLQRRIGRKTVGRKLLTEVPVILMAYDLLELNGKDIRKEQLVTRRKKLEDLLQSLGNSASIRLSPQVQENCWQDLGKKRLESRKRQVEGFVLKAKNSVYGVGRKRGHWWKWKVDPYSIDAVMLYAQRGSGRRASLYTDYTFGVWDGKTLVSFAKAYSGLNDSEIREVDRFVRQNTIEKFGPVRSVPAKLVMELHFEGISRSKRHKSGIAVRFPRIARWRKDKPPEEADSLDTIIALLPQDSWEGE